MTRLVHPDRHRVEQATRLTSPWRRRGAESVLHGLGCSLISLSMSAVATLLSLLDVPVDVDVRG